MSRTAKRPAPPGRKPPLKSKRCVAITATGKRCKNARMHGHDTCNFHLPGEALKAAQKGGEAVSDRWNEVKSACTRLPLHSLANQNQYVTALIDEWDRKRSEKGAIFVIATLLARLAAVTEDADGDGQPVTIERRIVRPLDRPPEGPAGA